MSQSNARLEKRYIDTGIKFHVWPSRGSIPRKSARMGAAYRALLRKGWTEAQIDAAFLQILRGANRADIAVIV